MRSFGKWLVKDSMSWKCLLLSYDKIIFGLEYGIGYTVNTDWFILRVNIFLFSNCFTKHCYNSSCIKMQSSLFSFFPPSLYLSISSCLSGLFYAFCFFCCCIQFVSNFLDSIGFKALQYVLFYYQYPLGKGFPIVNCFVFLIMEQPMFVIWRCWYILLNNFETIFSGDIYTNLFDFIFVMM